MRTVIIADLTQDQLSYLQNLAAQNGISAEYIVEGAETASVSVTPITGEMLQAVATELGKTVLEVAAMASQYNIETVEAALAHSDIPSSIKSILEQYV